MVAENVHSPQGGKLEILREWGDVKDQPFKGKYVNWNLQRGRGLNPPPPKKNLLGVTMNIFPGTTQYNFTTNTRSYLFYVKKYKTIPKWTLK